MADLRITGVSNNQLELQAPDGTRHYLEITDDLLKALRSREVSLPQNTSPREIQHLIRSGATVDEVVRQTGADQELVERFAKPILAELNHIVSLAKNIRLSLAGERFAEPVLVEFGSVMDERLVNNGARNISWSSKKNLDGDWLVSVSFSTSEGPGLATWSFDPKQLFLAPENETALQLSNGVPITVSKTIPLVAEVSAEPEVAVEPESHPTVMLTVVPEINSDQDTLLESPVPSDLFEEEIVTTASLHVVEVIDEVKPEAEDVATIEAVAAEVAVEEQKAEESAARPQASSRWAEVLFGSKDDEED